MKRFGTLCGIFILLSVPGNLLGFTVVDEFVIFDQKQNLYWMRDANYAMTIGASSDGTMTWAEAMSFMNGRVYYNTQGWRLPTRNELYNILRESYLNGQMPFVNFKYWEQNYPEGEYWSSDVYSITMGIVVCLKLPSGLIDYCETDDRYPDWRRHAIYVIDVIWMDDDSDGVVNNVDKCPNTPSGATVEINGCMEGDFDNDGDVDGDDLAKFSNNYGL